MPICPACDGTGYYDDLIESGDRVWTESGICPRCNGSCEVDDPAQKFAIPISAVWLHAVFDEHGNPTDEIRVCVEINGEWREIISAGANGHVSHISEANGFSNAAVVDIPGRVIRPATGGVTP